MPIVHDLICLRRLICNAPVAQWTRRLTTDQEIESSILSGGKAFFECRDDIIMRVFFPVDMKPAEMARVAERE